MEDFPIHVSDNNPLNIFDRPYDEQMFIKIKRNCTEANSFPIWPINLGYKNEFNPDLVESIKGTSKYYTEEYYYKTRL